MPSLLDEELNLSVLDSFEGFNLDEQDQDKKKETKTDLLDLSVLDDTFTKETQPLSKPPAKITSKFGKRKDPFGLGERFHNGVDIPMKLNTPIASLGRGIVTKTGDDGGKSYGKYVVVDYGGGLELTYGHLSKIGVEIGDKVTPEAFVGLSGSTGRSKSPHLHIRAMLNGKPVNPEDYFGSIHDVALGALTETNAVDEAKLDLSILDTLDEEQIKREVDNEQLDLSALDTLGDISVKPLEQLPYKDNRTIEEKIAAGAVASFQPKITSPNPNQLVGDQITTIIPVKGVNRPNINTITDYWLGAVDPSYSQINQEYRGMTNRNLIEFTGNAEYIGDNKYKLTARFTKSGTDIINAYIEGRKKGGPEAGWEAAYFKSQEIKRQEQVVRDELIRIKEANTDSLAKRHPYLTSILGIVSPITTVVSDPDVLRAGTAQAGLMDAQMVHNLKMLPEALYTLYRYGGDSEQYQQLIEKDREIQENLFSYHNEARQPDTTVGKVAAGTITGAMQFPKYVLAGSLGAGSLPTLAYVENLHRGNIAAARSALPMALMVGATRGFEQFANAGTSLYVTKLKDGKEIVERVEVGRGLGSFAPFARIRNKNLSITQEAPQLSGLSSELRNSLSIDDVQAIFLASIPTSIRALAPIERQLIMRGTNAFQNVGALLVEGITDPSELAANFVVGLTFPVGKQARGKFSEGRFGLIPYIPEARVSLKGLKAPAPIAIESDGQTLFLSLDTAALNLLDLRRALSDPASFKGLSLKESVSRQINIKKAIEVLGKQIPAETLKYFEDNETLIRSALKTNWDAIRAKEEYLGNRETTQEIRTPDEVKENPSIDIKESPVQRLTKAISRVGEIGKRINLKDNPEIAREIAKDVFGNDGELNTWQTPDRTLLAFDRLINYKTKNGNTLRSGLDLAAIGKDLVEGSKAIFDLTQISAFYLEDFYHRKVEPSITELANKFRVALGDIVKDFSDSDFQTLFIRGKEYLDSNIADPFFSRMKQDAVEKLPNRFTEQQARDILSQHKDEFEWTSGLKDFLEANKDKKISKQELIDIIQKGQVRVEERVADDVEYSKLQAENEKLATKIRNLRMYGNEEGFHGDKHYDAPNKDTLLGEYLTEKIGLEQRLGNLQRTRFSLRAYQGEKLELPGAKNSKEVKLISPLLHTAEFLLEHPEIPVDYAKYKSAHWDEGNIVAHYRSNDRISTDNKRIYFGEEFQSDWNHDIRVKYENKLENIARMFDEIDTDQFKRFGIEQKEKFLLDFANKYDKSEIPKLIEIANRGTKGKLSTEKQARYNELLEKRNNKTAIYDENYEFSVLERDKRLLEGNSGLEPNPFMQHNWKELVLKRFLRDAAIAKDENGNYKYDAIGWTTARQQLERYGGILEGKEFTWNKNANGTYSFGLRQTNTNVIDANSIDPATGYNYFHELQGISLERFAELTTKEAAEFVRKQESEGNKFIVQSNVGGQRGEFTTREEAQQNLRSGDRIIEESRGQFSLSETVELRSREGTYADYDVAYKNILNKIGKRFGAKYSEREIEVPEYFKDAEDNEGDFVSKKEKIHSLEITPSMRQSLEKEGLPLYGTGGSEALKYPETGVRNRLVTFDAFNSAREALVQSLTGELYHGSQFEFDTAHATGRHLEGWTYFTNNIEYAKIVAKAPGGKFHPTDTKYADSPVIYNAQKPPVKAPLDFRELGDGLFLFTDVVNLLKNRGIEVPQEIIDGFANSKPHGDMVDFFSFKPFREFLRKAAIDKGYDGLVIRDAIEAEGKFIIADSYISFNPTPVSPHATYNPNTFNSGLNPEIFIDNVKFLYGGIKDLVEFTNTLVERYGEPIREYAEDFYWAIRDKASAFNERLNIVIDKWQDNLNKNADDPAWQIRNKDQRGSFSLRKKKSPELEDYFTDKEKHQVPIGLDIRAYMRGIALSQLSTEFAKVYDTMRSIQRVVSSYETTSLNQLMAAKKLIKQGLSKEVADAIYQGNEWINPASGEREGKIWSDTELVANFGMNAQQIDAYKSVRAAIDNVLNLRLGGKLYSIRESATKLTNKLLTLTVGTPEYDVVASKISDLVDLQKRTITHYNDLKSSGYISLQRKGKIAAFVEDPSFPVGDPNRKIYNQFDSIKDANAWIQKQKAALNLPASYKGSIYDIRNLRDIVLKEKLTPSQFEDLVDRSSALTNDPQIEKLREEVYSKFPSFTYQLKREFVRGYDRDLQTAINSTVDQLELYASSFYSKVGREEGLKQLEATGIEKSDPNLYRLANSYINDETVPADLNWLSKSAIKARRFTYLWQLGFDVNQLWLNAVAQPITQTYGYFYRVTDPKGTGKQLTGLEPEHYFLKAGKQAADFYRGKATLEFTDIVNQLRAEKVLSPEFTKTFIEAQTGTGKASKLENWASIFMRTGEHLTRLHAASEAYLIGKEKFHLTGDELMSFIVKSVDATQTNPTQGENPFVVRQLGEGGKLFYQFMAFNQMWWENLALGVKNSKGSRKGLFLARELAPLAIMGGITGMPLAAFAGTMYTLITGKDPKKEMKKFLGDNVLIEQLARYGITTSAGISQKVTPQAPILDQVGRVLTTDEANIESLAANAPAIATGNQIWNARKILTGKRKGLALVNTLPRALKGPAKAIYTKEEGYKAGATTLMSKRRVTPLHMIGQSINITPTKVIEEHEERRTKKLKRLKKDIRRTTRSLKRAIF